ncbi:MAG: hypothetical protein RR988_03215 [Clostridia bacterium]
MQGGAADTSFDRTNGIVETVFLGKGENKFKYIQGTEYAGDVTSLSSKLNPNYYVVHPAFSPSRRQTFNSSHEMNFGAKTENNGFWISKFEMALEGSKPGTPSQANMTMKDRYIAGRDITENLKYGLKYTNFSSMNATSTQWGAATYLAAAIGNEPKTNAANLTGGGPENAYIANATQSTTGNPFGVYDMSGGKKEAVSMFCHNNKALTDQYILSIMGPLVENKTTRYVDVYPAGSADTRKDNYEAMSDRYGDAMYEISKDLGTGASGLAWRDNIAKVIFGNETSIYRGGITGNNKASGIYEFEASNSAAMNNSTWRAVLVVD